MQNVFNRYRKSISPPYTNKKDYLTLGITIIIVLFLPFLVWFLHQKTNLSQFASQLPTNPMGEQNAKHNKLVAESQHITGATNFLLAMAAEVRKKKNDPTFVKQLVATSQERQTEFSDLLDTNAQAVFENLLTDGTTIDTLSQIPGIVLEKKVSLTGTFTYKIVDNKQQDPTHVGSNENSTPELVTLDGTFYTLYALGTINAHAGSDITVNGFAVGHKLILPTTSSASISEVNITKTKVLGATTGPMNVVVLLGNFTDKTPLPSTSTILNVFQGNPGHDVDSYYNEASFGQTSVTQAVYGPYTFPYTSSTGCANQYNTGYDLMNLAKADVNFLNFNRIVVVFDCGQTYTSPGTSTITTPSGNIQGQVIWMDGSYSKTVGAYVHELGHTLGLYHADTIDCRPDSFRPLDNFDQVNPCFNVGYGDSFDVMGGSEGTSTPAHFGAWQKNHLGWLSQSNYPTITTSGTYTILPVEASSSGVLGLNIPRGNSGTSFSVEYRQPIGFDSYFTDPALCAKCTITQGATIKLVYGGGIQVSSGGGSDTQAIDTTPGSIPTTGFNNIADNVDGALLPGKAFTDPEYGITITTLAASSSGVTVQVTIPSQTCTHNTPTYSISPLTQAAPAGTTLNYTLTFTNTDSQACPSNTFRYDTNTDWRGMWFKNDKNHQELFNIKSSPDTFTLAPGASQTITVAITSPVSALSGSYRTNSLGYAWYWGIESNEIGVPVVYPIATNANSVLIYQVTAPVDTTPPSMPTNLAANAFGAKYISASWSPSTDNTGVVGYQVTENNRYLYTVTSPSFTDYNATPNTAYTLSIQAFDVNGNLSPAATVSVMTPAQITTLVPKAPVITSVTATDHSVYLNWTPSTGTVPIVSYVIYTNLDTYDPVMYLPGNATSATITNLQSNYSRVFQVLATDQNGNSSNLYNDLSNIVVRTAFIGQTTPSAPTTFYATLGTAKQISFSWTPSINAVSYRIYRWGRLLATLSNTTTSYTDSAVMSSGSYEYSIIAVDSNGNISSPLPQYAAPFLEYIAPPGEAAGTPGYLINTANGTNSTDTTPPVVTLSGLTNNQVIAGTANVSAGASDNVGVSKVELYIDGELNSTISSSPYTFSLNTTNLYDGNHWIFARAYDAAGNFTSTSIVSISVNNAGSPTVTPGITSTPTVTISPSPTPTLPTLTPTLIPSPTPTITNNQVNIVDFAFTPQTLTVPVGTTVTWKNTSTSMTHTSTSDTGVWNSGNIAPGGAYTFTFATPGTYTYHCAIHTTMTGTIIVTGTVPTVTPTPTPTLTPTRTPTPTNTPIPTATSTPVPTATLTPTPVVTKLALTIGLDGIGKAGDNVSRTSTGNLTPLHPTRTVTLTLFDVNNNQLPPITGQVTYDSISGLFKGTVSLPSSVVTGVYTLKASTSSFLLKAVTGILSLTQGQTTIVPTFDLVAGDINNDNQISLLDYNQILSCFGSSTTACFPSDLDDDGTVGGSDYNLFLRELSVQIGG